MATSTLREPTEDEQDMIWEAIYDDQADRLQRLLENVDVNAPLDEDEGWRPLHYAACYNSIRCTEIILKHKGDINITNKAGETPLQLAIERDANKVVYLLMINHNQQTSHLSQWQKDKADQMIEEYRKEHGITMLSEDCPRKELFAYFRENIRKGELVQMAKSNQWMVAYSNPPVLIDCQKYQLKFVKPMFVEYLLAVENLLSRFNLFINNLNSLTRNMLLDVGDEVDVTMEQYTIPATAVIKYKGNLPGKSGIVFGIKILDEDKFGDTDGTLYNERKFSCPANKGLFISIDKIQAKFSDSFMLEYAKQAAYGLAPSRTFKITFVGPESSGKSSTIRTLLGKKFNPKESSTIGAVLGIQAIINWFTGHKTAEDVQTFQLQSSHSIGWKEASVDDMQQILDNEFNKEMFSNLDFTSSPEHESELTTSQSTEAKFNFTENSTKSSDDFEEFGNVRKETDIIEEYSEQYSQVKNVVFGEKVDKLDSHACISDFAGQLTYFSFQLFFLKKRDTVIITFNASLELTAKIIPRERYDHAKKKRSAAGMMTTIENIEFWLQSVSAHAGTNDIPKGCISCRSPTAILCATHAEKLSEAEMVSVSEIIFGSLAGKPYAEHLPNDRTKAIIFISNKKRKKFKKNIINLQEVLMKAASTAYLEERPISYLRLEKLIAFKVKEDIPMISLEEFTKLVNKAGIPGESNSKAITAALQYSSIRGTILYFPEVEVLSKIVFISPDWLSSIFSKIITTHDQVVDKHPLHRAWKRYDTFAILEEQFLDHILKVASVTDPKHKQIIISLMELFNLLAEIPSNTCLSDESAPPPGDRKVYIVPALLLHNPDLSVFIPQNADQIYLFYFSELYFPESVFNQILVKMIRWNVQKQFQISRIHYGLGQFCLDNLHSYCLIYEPNNYTLKVCITQMDKSINKESQRKAFTLFVELMLYLEQSIHSVIKLYLPCTKPPVLHVFCPKCDDTSPHIILGSATKISLSLQNLCCAKTGLDLKLPSTSYLPFGDELNDDNLSGEHEISERESTELSVLHQFYKDLQNDILIDELLPSLVSKRIITINEKISITESGKNINERCQFFLDQYICKPLLAGDSSAFYKLLQLMDRSSKYTVLTAKMKQSLMIESLQDKTSENHHKNQCEDIQVTVSNKEEPFYTADDLKKKYEDQKAKKMMLQYDKLNAQQKDIVAKVQAIIVVVNDNEFMATMCYLAPPDHQNAILKIQFKTIVGPDSNPRIFYVGKFGECPVAVTRVKQGHGRDVVYHARKEYFKNLVLIAAIGVAAGFPENAVKLGDVLISDQIHDCSFYKHQDDSYIPRGNTMPASKFMLDILKDHFDWKFPCTKDKKRDASVKFGLILSKSILLNDAAERGRLLQYFGQEAKGFEMEGFGIMESSMSFIIIKGVCDFAGDKTKAWQPTAALAANDYLYHHFCQTDLSLLLEDEEQTYKQELTELSVLQQFYKDLQNGLPIDELLPQLVTKKIITINDKMLITKYSKNINERSQYFLDQYILKPLSAGDPSAFYKFLQIMETSSKCIVLAAKIKQILMVDKISEIYLSDTDVQKQLPEMDTLVTFYQKITQVLPVDELLPVLVTQRVITIDDKTRIAATGKTESERTQYLLDHHIARPLSAGDPKCFHKLLDVMSSSAKCTFLINGIQHHLSTAMQHQKFSGPQSTSLNTQ